MTADREGPGTGAGERRRGPDGALGRAARGGRLFAAAAPGGGGQRALRAVGDPGELADHPRRQVDVHRFQLLLAVGAREVERDRAVGTGGAGGRADGEAGGEGPRRQRLGARPAARVGAQGKFGGRGRGRIAGPGREAGRRRVRAADRRARQDRQRAAFEVEVEAGERDLRDFVDRRRQLACDRVGGDVADQPHVDPIARRGGVDENPVLLAGGRIATQLSADVDVAFELVGGFGQRRRFDLDGADLRPRRAGDRGGRVQREAGVVAGLQVGGGRRIDPHADRQRHRRRFGHRAVLAAGVLQVRDSDVDSGFGGRVRHRRPRLDRDRRVIGNRPAFLRRGAGRDRRLERRPRIRRKGEAFSLGLAVFGDRVGEEEGRVEAARLGEGFPVTGAGQGEEGAVAGAAVEDEPVLEDGAGAESLDRDRRRNGDVEALVVVAVAEGVADARRVGHVAFDVDRVAGEVEAKARGLPVRRRDVVDRDRGDPRDRLDDGAEDRVRHRGLAFADSRSGRAGFGVELGLGADFRRPRVDAKPDRKVDANVLEFVDRFFGFDAEGFGRGVADDELGEAEVRMPGGLFEEEFSGRAFDVAEFRRFGVRRRFLLARPRLPAGVDAGVMRVARGDDVAGRGSGERRTEQGNRHRNRRSSDPRSSAARNSP